MRQALWRVYQSQPALKRPAWRIYERLIGLKPRHETDYATHIPVLAAVSVLANPKNITEFGAGGYSTPLFLNRSVFPNLNSIVSLENDETWYARMRGMLGGDQRLDLRYIQGDLSLAVTQQLLTTDLVFIDDSASAIRKHTILAVGEKAPAGVPVVIHDADYPWTRLAIRRAFDHCFVFKAFQPQTAIAWNVDLRFRHELRHLSRGITLGASAIPPSDGVQWRDTLSAVFGETGQERSTK